MAFNLASSAFRAGETIPVRHTCDGANLSPALTWTDPPAGTKALALVMDDPDAPSGTFTHWLLWDLAPTERTLPEGSKSVAPAVGGANDFGRTGYGGPCPPKGHGPHRYRFHLHALDRPLGLPPGAPRGRVDKALGGRIIATATLEGVYERKR